MLWSIAQVTDKKIFISLPRRWGRTTGKSKEEPALYVGGWKSSAWRAMACCSAWLCLGYWEMVSSAARREPGILWLGRALPPPTLGPAAPSPLAMCKVLTQEEAIFHKPPCLLAGLLPLVGILVWREIVSICWYIQSLHLFKNMFNLCFKQCNKSAQLFDSEQSVYLPTCGWVKIIANLNI